MVITVKKDISDVIVNTDVLAEAFSFTRQRINQLAKEGVLDKQAPGRFLLLRNIQKYVEYQRLGNVADEEDGATAQYWEEKALHEKAKREMAELKLAQFKNRLYDADHVELVWVNVNTTVKNRIMGVPSRAAPKLIGIKSITEIQELIDIELREALQEIADFDPAMFAGGEVFEDEEEDNQTNP